MACDYNPELALHCLAAPGKFMCPIIKQRSVMMGQQAVDCEGRTPLERLKVMLDRTVEQLMDSDCTKKQANRLKGTIYAFSFSIACIENPYLLDHERVKEEAWQRYLANHPEGDDES